MIEDSKVVKSITAKPGGKSGTYWTVTWQDGKTDNIFNADWLPLLEQSQKENCLLYFTKEKSEDGKFYNIKSLKLIAKTVEVSVKKPSEVNTEKPKTDMSKDDWSMKDKITRKSIERQTALNAAVKVAELMAAKEKITEGIISTAKRFELYLETGIDVAAQAKQQEVTGAKSQLVQAAKAMGAKVIAEGQKEGG